MIVLAATALMFTQSAGQVPKVDLKQLKAGRKWLFEATNEREGSGYFDNGEASPDGILFEVGQSDVLYYCSMFLDDEQPKNNGYFVTCWTREGSKAKRLWQVKLLPGREQVKGSLLRFAGSKTVEMYFSKDDGKGGQSSGHVKINGFHPDSKAEAWKLAQGAMEADKVLVHYHFNWHGDPSLGHYVDLHDAKGAEFGNEILDRSQDFIITKKEKALLKSEGKL